MVQKSNLELLQLVGAFLMIIGIFLITLIYQGMKFNNFKKNGIETKARVVKKYTKRTRTVLTEYARTSKGATQKYRTDFMLDIAFFTNSQNTQNRGGLKLIKAKTQIDDKNLKTLKKGDEVEITYLPDDPENTAVIKKAIKTCLDDTSLKRYQKNGITVKANIIDIDVEKHLVHIMFMTKLNAKIGNYISSRLDVSKSVWDSVNEGGEIEIVYLPDNPKENVVSKAMLKKGMINPYFVSVLAMLSFVIGIFLMLKIGIKK